MSSTLSISYVDGSNTSTQKKDDAKRKLQIIVDSAVAPRIDLLAQNAGASASVTFPDGIAPEQVLACYQAVVNLAGLPETPFNPSTVALSGTVTPGSRQRIYSV